jgi:hypothetical protein
VNGCAPLFLILLVFEVAEQLLGLIALRIEVQGQVVDCLVLALSLVYAVLDHKVLRLIHRLHIFTRYVHESRNQLRDILFFKFKFVETLDSLVGLVLDED